MSDNKKRKNTGGIRDAMNDAMYPQLGKIPPQALELEEGVLGAILLEPKSDSVQNTLMFLGAEDFYKNEHSLIFEAITCLIQAGEPVDILTVTQELRKRGKLEEAGGPLKISQLTNKVASSANVESHARIVVQKSLARQMISISSSIVRDAYEDACDIFDLIDKAQMQINQLLDAKTKTQKKIMTMGDVTNEILDEVSKMNEHSELSGIPGGLEAMNKETRGDEEGSLIVVAARPSMGKSAHMVSDAVGAEAKYKIPCALFSLEVPAKDVGKRIISQKALINGYDFKTPSKKDSVIYSIGKHLHTLTSMKIYIDDTSNLSVYDFRNKARKLVKKYGVKRIYVDYLQLMNDGAGSAERIRQLGKNRMNNRDQEIGEITRVLKQTAKELSIVIIAYSQLGRSVEETAKKIPTLRHLRESGSIEQDADMVQFLYRPEYYGFMEDENGASNLGIGCIFIAKFRNGSVNLEGIKFRFVQSYTLWLDLESTSPVIEQAIEKGNQSGVSPNTNFIKGDKWPDEENMY